MAAKVECARHTIYHSFECRIPTRTGEIFHVLAEQKRSDGICREARISCGHIKWFFPAVQKKFFAETVYIVLDDAFEVKNRWAREEGIYWCSAEPMKIMFVGSNSCLD